MQVTGQLGQIPQDIGKYDSDREIAGGKTPSGQRKTALNTDETITVNNATCKTIENMKTRTTIPNEIEQVDKPDG